MTPSHSSSFGQLSVLHDDVIFRRQRFGGISQFWRRLTSALRTSQGINYCWEQSTRLAMLRPSVIPDVIFHSSYYRYSSGRRSKTVTTAHDFIHERGFATAISPWRAKLFTTLKHRTLQKSAVIVCVSHATAQDLKELYPRIGARRPVCVIHHGPTIDADAEPGTTADRSAIHQQRPYFLFVGVREGYKNFALTLHAFRELRLSAEDACLYVVGKSFTPTELSAINALGLNNLIVNLGSVSDAILRDLYTASLALIYPSSYEGFGLPVLDAMSVGCPVIAARIPAIVEVAGEAAEFCDPDNVDSLVRAICSLFSVQRRLSLRELGLKRSRRFSWDNAALEYIAAYQTAAETV